MISTNNVRLLGNGTDFKMYLQDHRAKELFDGVMFKGAEGMIVQTYDGQQGHILFSELDHIDFYFGHFEDEGR